MKLRIVLLLLLCGALGKVHAVQKKVYTIPQSKHLGIVGVVKRILDYFVKPGPDSFENPNHRYLPMQDQGWIRLWNKAQDAFNIPIKDRVPIVWRKYGRGRRFARYYSRFCVMLSPSFDNLPIDTCIHIFMREAARHKRALEGASAFIPSTIVFGAAQSLYMGGVYMLYKHRAALGTLGVVGMGLLSTLSFVTCYRRSFFRASMRHAEYEANRLSLATPCYSCAKGALAITLPGHEKYGKISRAMMLQHVHSLQKHHKCKIHSPPPIPPQNG